MRGIIEDKRGQQMTLTSLILIVLGIVVLVFLIYGFSTGWNNLFDKLTAFGGGGSNVDTIRQACAIACSSDGTYAFCNQSRTVDFGNGTKPESRTCVSLVGDKFVDECGTLCQPS